MSHTPTPAPGSSGGLGIDRRSAFESASVSTPFIGTPEDLPPAEIVAQVHAGRIAVADLPAAVRRHCIDHLTGEGFDCAEIVQLMRISESTVRRDRAALRREHALTPDLKLGDQMIGELQRVVLASVQRLIRIARDPESPPYVRVWAEHVIVAHHQRLFDAVYRARYAETGSDRLAYQRRTDPAEQRRQRESLTGLHQTFAGLLGQA